MDGTRPPAGGMFPISTAYTAWNRPQQQYPGSAAVNALQAAAARAPQVRILTNLDRQRVPTMTRNMVGDRLNRLPQTNNVRLGPPGIRTDGQGE